jgi:hypothetical protein
MGGNIPGSHVDYSSRLFLGGSGETKSRIIMTITALSNAGQGKQSLTINPLA